MGRQSRSSILISDEGALHIADHLHETQKGGGRVPAARHVCNEIR